MGKSNSGNVKVLQIAGGFRDNVMGEPLTGGVAAFLNNYYSKMDHNLIHFDFLSLRNQTFEKYRHEFETNNAKLFCLDIQSNGIIRFFETIVKLQSFLKTNKYDAVHINIGAFFPVLSCAIAAKLSGVKNIIAHSHSAGINSKKKRFIIDILSPFLSIFADQYCACSLVAAENLYSKSIIKNNQHNILKNAIDIDVFRFEPNIRKKVREELNIDSNLVIGHVGRFVDVKNHKFLVDFFWEYQKTNNDAILLLIGDGELRSSIEEKVNSYGIANKVIFMGNQNNVSQFYQAMDVFVLPSVVEGFPIVALEAQSTGLPTYISTSITSEVKLSESCRFFDLTNGAKNLANKINSDEIEVQARVNGTSQIIAAGYDLNTNIQNFQELYLSHPQ